MVALKARSCKALGRICCQNFVPSFDFRSASLHLRSHLLFICSHLLGIYRHYLAFAFDRVTMLLSLTKKSSAIAIYIAIFKIFLKTITASTKQWEKHLTRDFLLFYCQTDKLNNRKSGIKCFSHCYEFFKQNTNAK